MPQTERGFYLGRVSSQLREGFHQPPEALLFPSPCQQRPQVLPAPGAVPPRCPQLQVGTEAGTGDTLLLQGHGVPSLVVPSICSGTGQRQRAAWL